MSFLKSVDGKKDASGKGPKRRVLALVAAALLGAAIAAGAMLGLSQVQMAQSAQTTSTTIKNSLSDISELATAEYSFANVGKFTEDDMQVLGISIPFTGSSFIVTYEGTVKAGISDIGQAEVSVDDAAKTVTVTLPDVGILSCAIDPSTLETYDQTFNPINQIQVSDVSSFLSEEEGKEREEATSNGTLDKARTHAEEVISAFVSSILQGTSREGYAVSIAWTASD